MFLVEECWVFYLAAQKVDFSGVFVRWFTATGIYVWMAVFCSICLTRKRKFITPVRS